MIIKKERLASFIKEYNKLIGTYFEVEGYNAEFVHAYAFDIETEEEELLFGRLYKEYNEKEH